MPEEALADSGGFDMDGALDTISSDLGFTSEEDEAQDESPEEITEEVTEDSTEEVTEEAEEHEVAKKSPPNSWKKEMHEKFSTLDPEVQDYIEQRENQMREGLEKDRGDSNLGRVMRDVMSPYSNLLKSQGINESDMVRNLMNAHYRISTSDDAGRLGLIQQLAQSYGISLDGSAPQAVDPTIKAMQDKLQGLERHISTSHEQALQAARERVQSDVEAFASDPAHEFFDEVSEQIIPLINAGYELEDAYQNAIWLNPVTRQKEIDRTSKEAAEKAQLLAKQEAEKAKKLKSVNVRGRDTNRTPTEATGTMEDTMRETYREINSRT